jgi:hypothetical protein
VACGGQAGMPQCGHEVAGAFSPLIGVHTSVCRLAGPRLPCHNAPMPRLCVRRVFLATLLALAAWWGIGACLAIRPLYTLCFPIHETEKRVNYPPTREFAIRSFDREGRYLLIELPVGNGRDFAHWEVRETATGRVITTIDLPAQALRDDQGLGSALGRGRWFASDGTISFLEPEPDGKGVWQQNVFTGERRRLGAVPPAGEFVFSRNGSTLLLYDDVSPLHLLSLSAQPALATANLLALPNDDSHPRWCRCRVWSLPDVRQRFTTWLPSPVSEVWERMGIEYPLPSHDGTWLPVSHHDPNVNGTSILDPKLAPQRDRLRIVNCITGGFLEVPFPAFLGRFFAGPGSFVSAEGWVRQGGDSRLHREFFYFHVPNGPWFQRTKGDFILHSDPLDVGKGITRFAEYHRNRDIVEIRDISPEGVTALTAAVRTDYLHLNKLALVPERSYLVLQGGGRSRLPDWLVTWLTKIPYVRAEIERVHVHRVLMDYSTGQELWRTTYEPTVHTSFLVVGPGRYLVTSHREDDDHVVNVVALPIKPWSRWWARAAGLIVFVVVLLALRRRAVRSHRNATLRA